jgi:hypothetical protein
VGFRDRNPAPLKRPSALGLALSFRTCRHLDCRTLADFSGVIGSNAISRELWKGLILWHHSRSGFLGSFGSLPVIGGHLGELDREVTAFFEDGFKAIRSSAGQDARIVFMFDSLEKIHGSLSNEAEVAHSVEVVFSNYLKLLEIPNLHVIYTVPPWLKFLLSRAGMRVLPCVRLWNNDGERTRCEPGIAALRELLRKRFGAEGLDRFFGPDPFSRADELIQLCGGHFRDLLLLLRETVLRAKALPVSDESIQAAIVSVRNGFLPISYEDAMWLEQIGEKRSTVLRNTDQTEVSRITRFLDTHIVLYLRNGNEWYDIHPLVREEVAAIAGANGSGV